MKDVSGSYAVFTEQGSSASQKTAAKAMDVMDKQQMQYQLSPRSKIEGAPSLFQKFRRQNVQIFGHVYQNTNGLNHGPARKIQSFLLSEICTVTL